MFQLVEASRNYGRHLNVLLTDCDWYCRLHCVCFFTRQLFISIICYLNRVSYTRRFNGYFPGKLRVSWFPPWSPTWVSSHCFRGVRNASSLQKLMF